MKPRPVLSAVLGLVLMVQGVAVASAPLALDAQSQEPAAAQDSAAVQMSCHGAAAELATPADTAAESPLADADTESCACCDGGCTTMSNCAFGHIAAAPAVAPGLAPAAQVTITMSDRAVPSISLPSRLRPPIVFSV